MSTYQALNPPTNVTLITPWTLIGANLTDLFISWTVMYLGEVFNRQNIENKTFRQNTTKDISWENQTFAKNAIAIIYNKPNSHKKEV